VSRNTRPINRSGRPSEGLLVQNHYWKMMPHPGIGTGISEASKRVPNFPFPTQGMCKGGAGERLILTRWWGSGKKRRE